MRKGNAAERGVRTSEKYEVERDGAPGVEILILPSTWTFHLTISIPVVSCPSASLRLKLNPLTFVEAPRWDLQVTFCVFSII